MTELCEHHNFISAVVYCVLSDAMRISVVERSQRVRRRQSYLRTASFVLYAAPRDVCSKFNAISEVIRLLQ